MAWTQKFRVDTFSYKKIHRRPYATRKPVLPKHDGILQKKNSKFMFVNFHEN
jgi:hypothetical protein